MTKWFRRLGWTLLALLLLAAVAAWLLLRASLPALDGQLSLPGLAAPATIHRDALGTATVEAASEADAMRALGYVHAQERYFEMDLMRRTAAGELAALFGPVALESDKRARVHRMRTRATAQLDAIAGDKRPLLQAYADGVNAGLRDLNARPWPYLLLGATPEPWRLADSALVGYAMYFDLQDERNARELALWRLRPHLPPALYGLLIHAGSSWDAPVAGRARGDAVLPSADQVDLRALPAPAVPNVDAPPPGLPRGSNNFAVSGALTADGRAIVADDMHLGLRAPNIWFRARLRYADARAPDGSVDVAGFTLPGLPGVVVGSNGHVAWGFTNSYGDWLDWARQPACGAYAPPHPLARPCPGERVVEERIEIAGEAPFLLPVHETAWGPILHREPDGTSLALRWAAHLPGSMNFGLLDFARAASIDELLRMADQVALPAQNLVAGDRHGRIAWRLLGPMLQRAAECPGNPAAGEILQPFAPDPPAAAAGGTGAPCPRWTLTSVAAPAIVDPGSGRLWSANSRVVDGAALARIGDGGYVLGARAKQIRNALFARQRFDERALLAIQLDDRALFLQRWWILLRSEATRAGTPALRELAAAAHAWDGHAGTDSVSYRIVRAWRLAVHERIADGLTAPAQAALDSDFAMPSLPQFEGVAWPLLEQRPPHLLSPRFDSWDALLEDAAGEVRDQLAGHGPLARRTWGERNTARICHPLARALPVFVAPALCMPFEPLPGDSHMPRVQAPDEGASERMVVAPGHEADGIVHMPGGQSGHPLSPFWGAGHDDWVHGRPTPFLPGPARHTLRLAPP